VPSQRNLSQILLEELTVIPLQDVVLDEEQGAKGVAIDAAILGAATPEPSADSMLIDHPPFGSC
jgi:hypothetical protein